MLDSSKSALSIKAKELNSIKQLCNFSDHEIRSLFAIKLQKVLHSNEKREKIFDDFKIKRNTKKLNNFYDKYEYLFDSLLKIINIGENSPNPEGKFELNYSPRYVNFDEDQRRYILDLDELQDGEAKFKDLNLFKGQVILIYNPKKKCKIKVITKKIKVPAHESELTKNMASNKNDFSKFSKILNRAGHDDIILIFKDGELFDDW